MDHELEQLGERIAEQAAHLDAAMHRLLADLRDFDARGGWHAQGAASCAHWLAWRIGWDLVTARDHMRVARKLAEFPVIDDALRCGVVSYSKVRAMLRVATPENEVLLLEYAKLMTASQLEKQCRKYALVQRHGQDVHPQADEQRRYVRRRDTEDGMVKIEAVLHPEEAEMVWLMLDRAAAQLVREPNSRSGGDSTKTSAASPIDDSAESRQDSCPAARPGFTHADPLPPAAGPISEPDAAACRIRDAGTALPISSPINDSAESHRNSCPAARPGFTHADPLPPAAGPISEPDAAACQVSTGAQTPTVMSPELPQRPLLDRLLDEADALRGFEVEAHDAMSDLHDAECELEASVEAARVQVDAAGNRREAASLRDRAAAARRAFNRADALVAVAQGYLRGGRPERTPIEVVLTIPASSLRTGATLDPVEVGEMGEAFLSGETARRLSCDAGVVEIIEDEHGAPLSVGRKRRTIAGALQRALRKRDGACSYPGCTNRLFLEGHHIQHWADGGETSLENAALLCSLHHRYVHEYGYTIDLGPDRRPRFRDPHGRCVAAVPERPHVPGLGWPQIRVANEALHIDADTIAGPWDGTPVDYGRIVGHLATADGLA